MIILISPDTVSAIIHSESTPFIWYFAVFDQHKVGSTEYISCRMYYESQVCTSIIDDVAK